jgi:aryl-alcohol dehydrogenase-like predicted oxidoreductase
LIRENKVDCLQVLFNVLNQEPARELIPLAEKENVGILARVPLASGLLTGKFKESDRFFANDTRSNYLSPRRMSEVLEKIERLKELSKDSGYSLTQISLAFLLRFAGVTAPIPGAKNPQQVEQNASASEIQLSDQLFAQIKKELSGYNFFLRYNVRV